MKNRIFVRSSAHGEHRVSALSVFIFTSLFATIFSVPSACGASGDITTVAGTTNGFSGDTGQAISAKMADPTAVAVDGLGNLYIADKGNHRVRFVSAFTGVITTIAGNGFNGFSGDTGPATAAELNLPTGVAVDTAGNVFIVDAGNARIRKVDVSNQKITTVAGGGSSGLGDGGPAVNAVLNSPNGIAVDSSGNLFISTYFGHRIRKVDTSGSISTLAGDGTAGFSGDGGPATSAQLNRPAGVAVDSFGNVYIADSWNHRIRMVDSSGNITTVAGSATAGFAGDGGPAISARLFYPSGVSLGSTANFFIADSSNNRIRMVDSAGEISTVAGSSAGGLSGDNGPATSAQLQSPVGVAAVSGGDLFIADTNNHRIRKVEDVLGASGGGSGGSGGSSSSGPEDTWTVWYQKADSDFAAYAAIGDLSFANAFYYYNMAIGDYLFYTARGRTAEALYWFHIWVGVYHYYYFQIIPGSHLPYFYLFQWYAYAYYYYHSTLGDAKTADEQFSLYFTQALGFL